MVTRRAALLALTSTSAAGLALACRNNGQQADAALIRQWFKSMHQRDLSEAEVAAIAKFLHGRFPDPDAAIQPALLSDPDVDLG